MVLIGVGLAHWVHPGWLFLPVFVGVNLIQSAFTGFCPAAMIMKACGMSCCHERRD